MLRNARFLPLAAALLSGGCSFLIARSGKDLTGLATREEIRAQLAEPIATSVEDGNVIEEYRTRRKIAEPYARRYFSPGYPMLLSMTFGTSELISVPYELSLIGRRTLRGQTLRVIYYPDGMVANIYVNGESLYPLGRDRRDNPWLDAAAASSK